MFIPSCLPWPFLSLPNVSVFSLGTKLTVCTENKSYEPWFFEEETFTVDSLFGTEKLKALIMSYTDSVISHHVASRQFSDSCNILLCHP